MPASSIVRQLQQRLYGAAAEGINSTLISIMGDLRQNVPVRSGNLLRNYRITQPASAANLKGIISNSVFYEPLHYPFRPSPNAYRDAPSIGFASGPSLFKPEASGEIDTEDAGQLLRLKTEQAIREQLL